MFKYAVILFIEEKNRQFPGRISNKLLRDMGVVPILFVESFALNKTPHVSMLFLIIKV